MAIYGPGVGDKSELYFNSPSPAAQNMYFYLTDAGHYYCSEGYYIERDEYRSLLILHVVSGTFTFSVNGSKLQTAVEGETVFLNCHLPHYYFTNDTLEAVWIHIDGQNICDFCYEIGGLVPRNRNSDYVRLNIENLIDIIAGRKAATEPQISLLIYKILIALTEKDYSVGGAKIIHENNIKSAIKYLNDNIGSKISVADLAAVAHISETHFSRLFKQFTGLSPYGFILISRINKAKFLLQNTDKSIAEIGFEAGFNSEANFVYSFKRNTGISPGKFRKLKF